MKYKTGGRYVVTKYHINKHGVPAICKAKNGNCPLGGEENHFDSQQEAQAHADKVNEESHGLLPNVVSEQTPEQEKIEEEMNEEFYNKLTEHSDYYANDGSTDVPYGADTDPIEFANEYFQARIKKEYDGEDINLRKYDNSDVWVEEIEEKRDDIFPSGQYGGSAGYWDSSSKDSFNEAINEAEEVGVFYEGRKQVVEEAFEEVKKIDWTKTGKTQEQGERYALQELLDNDILDV